MTLDLWRYQAFVGVGLISFFFPIRYFSKIGIAGTLLWSYVLLSCAFGFMNPAGIYGPMQIRIDQSSGSAFAIALMAPIFVLSIKRRSLRYLFYAFELFVVIDASIVLLNGYGLFNNASMDTAFMAAMMPMILFRPERYAFTGEAVRIGPFRTAWIFLATGLPLVTILTSFGATAIITLAVGLSVYGLLMRRSRAIVAAGLALGLGLWIQKSLLWDSNGRFDLWRAAMDWWLQNANFFYGTGFGTFEWLGLEFQHNPKVVFLFMHNEPLQVLFEGGALGLAIASLFVARVMVSAGDRAWLLATCFSLITLSLAQFPLRFFFSAVFVLLIARVALEPEPLEPSWRK